ncbi:hypothetical protein ACXX82_24570 [Glaciimonas sp. GNP009]
MSQWPSQNECLFRTTQTIQSLVDDGIIKPVDAEAMARLINGTAHIGAL